MTEKYLTVNEAAERLGVTPRTVRNWIDDQIKRYTRLSPRLTRIPESEIERLITEATWPRK